MRFASFYTGFDETMMARPRFFSSFVFLIIISTGKVYCCRCFPWVFYKNKTIHFNRTCLPRKLDLTRSAPTQCCIVIVVVHYSRVNGTSCFCYNSLVLDKLFTLRSERLGNKSSLERPVIYNVLNNLNVSMSIYRSFSQSRNKKINRKPLSG